MASLESQLNESHKEADQIHENMSSEMTAIKRKYFGEMEREKQQLEQKIVHLNKEVEVLKAEVINAAKFYNVIMYYDDAYTPYIP